MSIILSINLNKIALMRNSRPHNNPSPVEFAEIAIGEGADGITVHPRPDGRHIRPDDVCALGEFIRKHHPHVTYNIEANPFGAVFKSSQTMIDFVCDVCPDQFTAVPDSPDQPTSDHGWTLDDGTRPKIGAMIQTFKKKSIPVSLFVDPDPAVISAVGAVQAPRIEIYTELYARAYHTDNRHHALQQCVDTAAAAQKLGIGVNAGHDLDLDNLRSLLALPGLREVSIGHALTADALRYGFANTIKKYRRILDM